MQRTRNDFTQSYPDVLSALKFLMRVWLVRMDGWIDG